MLLKALKLFGEIAFISTVFSVILLGVSSSASLAEEKVDTFIQKVTLNQTEIQQI